MDFGKLINSLVIQKPGYLWDSDFFLLFSNDFLPLLLSKIYVFNICNVVVFFQIFIMSRNVKILIVLNFWLQVYTSIKKT